MNLGCHQSVFYKHLHNYLALQFDAVQAKGDAFRALVGANLALGGGWEVAYQSANQARAH